MDTQTGTSPRDGDKGVDRRRLLQGAVAAGVGAVAWTSPSISSMGGTPAYAAVCTGGFERFILSWRNTSCNCKSDTLPGNYVAYHPPETTSQCTGIDPNPPRIVTILKSINPDVTLENGQECPPDAGGSAHAKIEPRQGVRDYQFCRVRVDAVDGNCSNEVLATAFTGVVEKGVTARVPMPLVRCDGLGRIFLRISLECADDDACLPPA